MGRIDKTFKAKPISYDTTKKRSYDSVTGIVLHYTAVKGDSAINEAKFYSLNNTREAGFHLAIDRDGYITQIIPLFRTAWAVGGSKYKSCYISDGGRYYDTFNNYNTVSIELCDTLDKYPSKKQKEALVYVIKYVRRYCKNANTIIRHYDVNGKPCPLLYCGSAYRNLRWRRLLKYLQKNGC